MSEIFNGGNLTLHGEITPVDITSGGLTTSPNYKYNEATIIADLQSYVNSTYGEHYSTDEEVTCFDAWIALGESTPTFRNTALKYLWRYGKKNGNNKKDLMKAMHYIILALHNDHYKTKGE